MVTLTNTTLSGNSATYGGGVYNHAFSSGTSVVTLARSLLSGNTAPKGAEVYNFTATITANDYNLLGYNGLTNAQAFVNFTPSGSDLTATSDGTTPKALSAILNTTLANNGGPTKTHNLVAGSPAIDVFFTACPATDQRGFLRPVDGNGDTIATCDIGAVEFGSPPCIGAVATTGCTVNGVPDQLCQGTGAADTILGTAGDDIILGKGGPDTLRGKGGNDLLCGGDGNDTLDGGGGNDTLVGGRGQDTLLGTRGEDLLLGGKAIDVLGGGKGKDNLSGARGDDTLTGGRGDDTLNGGAGTDALDGGPGFDTCTSGEPFPVNCE
jgi:Ca2+-binding RTX toxin-like protein